MFGPPTADGELCKTPQSVPSTSHDHAATANYVYATVAVFRTVLSKRHISELLSILYCDIVQHSALISSPVLRITTDGISVFIFPSDLYCEHSCIIFVERKFLYVSFDRTYMHLAKQIRHLSSEQSKQEKKRN